MPFDAQAAHAAAGALRGRLLARRGPAGFWEGELSSSALSTATAVFTLKLAAREGLLDSRHLPLLRAGAGWLVRTQGSDGGWGDTVRSASNVSTTILCRAALASLDGAGPEETESQRRAGLWLRAAAGGLEPEQLAAAVMQRYGRDQTFSVPILTMCALAGRLGPDATAWRFVAQLPFEVAACPRSWFGRLRLPVVSYALPALIAIGQLRHARRPTRNPLLRRLRDAARMPTLRVLESIQPAGGGFLEATPLTAFVTMSLIGSGNGAHRVAREGLSFLVRSARPDGSWPIDTHLATWVTTGAVNALAGGGELADALAPEERDALRTWLLEQQLRRRHDFTLAAPGGWAWTPLPGGVPDADDTAGALLALHHLGPADEATLAAADAGVTWLLDLQNRDGGVPTFCRGWGTLPFDRSGADLTAHALTAWSAWRPALPHREARLRVATGRALAYLGRQQRADGAWIPLWFGNEAAAGQTNATYGTARVLLALQALRQVGHAVPGGFVERGAAWLLGAQDPDGGWGAGPGTHSSIEETGLAVQALCGLETAEARVAVRSGLAWLAAATLDAELPAAPIGFYFANLWYSEALYPYLFAVGAFERWRRVRDASAGETRRPLAAAGRHR